MGLGGTNNFEYCRVATGLMQSKKRCWNKNIYGFEIQYSNKKWTTLKRQWDWYKQYKHKPECS